MEKRVEDEVIGVRCPRCGYRSLTYKGEERPYCFRCQKRGLLVKMVRV